MSKDKKRMLEKMYRLWLKNPSTFGRLLAGINNNHTVMYLPDKMLENKIDVALRKKL